MSDLQKLSPFKYFVLTNFPFIEADFDALTNYELMCEVTKYINQISDRQNEVIDAFNDLETDFTQLETSMATYRTMIDYKIAQFQAWFDNLDVQDEINTKLDQMAQDGSLSDLVEPFIPSVVTAWLAEHITQPTNPVVDSSLTVSGAAADAKITGDRITDVNTALDYYVENYTNDINILNKRTTVYRANCYFYNGDYTGTSNYSVFAFPMEVGQTITIGCRFRYLCKLRNNIVTAETPAGYEYTATTTETIYLTVFNSDINSWIAVNSTDNISDAVPYGKLGLNKKLIEQSTGLNPNLIMSQKAITEAITEAINPDKINAFYVQYKGNDQSHLLGTHNSIKKNKVINFNCNFDSFGTLEISLLWNNVAQTIFAIDSENLTRTVNGVIRPAQPHGLTISDRISVTIETSLNTIKITIVSNGQSYTQTYEYAMLFVQPSYSVNDMTISNVDFSWTCKDFKKNIWLFGDSYISYGTNRWMYYLHENGYTVNCLIDGYAGENSNNALQSLQNIISLAKPNCIVWCLGMNDGGDSSEAPSRTWLTAINSVINICEENDIKLILATIPTVPTINHEQKNSFVRNSGYQYIDFAEAVGATSSGSWFTGMLSSDNVHPTVAGAMALYQQAITDCPQLMISN